MKEKKIVRSRHYSYTVVTEFACSYYRFQILTPLTVGTNYFIIHNFNKTSLKFSIDYKKAKQ